MRWAYDGQLVDVLIGCTCPKCGERVLSHQRYCSKCMASVVKPVEKWLRCEVVCAMGVTARIVNTLHGIDTWMDVSQLREVSPHGNKNLHS